MKFFSYFAYGSNMSLLRLTARTPGAVRHPGHASLTDHELRFHKIGRDGSAKCDACFSKGGTMYGVLYKVPVAEKHLLDQAEGLGNGYTLKEVRIALQPEEEQVALTYCATHIDTELDPFDWYKQHVLRGAREASLPRHYIRSIEAVRAITDPDSRRASAERAIYEPG